MYPPSESAEKSNKKHRSAEMEEKEKKERTYFGRIESGGDGRDEREKWRW